MGLLITILGILECIFIGIILVIMIGTYICIKKHDIDYELETRFFKSSIKIKSNKRTR